MALIGNGHDLSNAASEAVANAPMLRLVLSTFVDVNAQLGPM
jgi:hypothetical protein